MDGEIHVSDYESILADIPDQSVALFVCDGPYGVTRHSWDQIDTIQEFNLNLIQRCAPKLMEGGALYLFGKPNCLDFIDYRPYLNLQSRIVWYQPSRLSQGRVSYTNNYDTICYFLKGNRARVFNLDEIRVPQLVELEHRQRCENVPSVKNGHYGKTKFNDKGKNPGDVWGDVKQLTYKSKELVNRAVLNTIQKPVRLMERIVLASSNEGDLVVDPFCGVGTCLVACQKSNRRFIGCDINAEYVQLARQRVEETHRQQKDLLFT